MELFFSVVWVCMLYITEGDAVFPYLNCVTTCVWQSAPTCLKEVLEQLLDAVVSYTEPTGRLVSELFQKLPSKMVWAPSVKHFP